MSRIAESHLGVCFRHVGVFWGNKGLLNNLGLSGLKYLFFAYICGNSEGC